MFTYAHRFQRAPGMPRSGAWQPARPKSVPTLADVKSTR